MEVASDGEVAEPKFRVSHKESCSALLRDGEAFTAIAAGPTVIALGTSASTVIVVTLDGEFVCKHSFSDKLAVVTEICIIGDLVVHGNSRGQVICLDWRNSQVTDLSTSHAPIPIRSLALGPDFSASAGAFFITQKPTSVVMRSRSTSGHFIDTVIFEDSNPNADFDTMFHGLPAGVADRCEVDQVEKPPNLDAMPCVSHASFFARPPTVLTSLLHQSTSALEDIA
eukprot:m.294677 g.294677  ORF g.294677 m.294677 type:complete len:226 (-) comp27166_c2_seq16:2144-2821(-)